MYLCELEKRKRLVCISHSVGGKEGTTTTTTTTTCTHNNSDVCSVKGSKRLITKDHIAIHTILNFMLYNSVL